MEAFEAPASDLPTDQPLLVVSNRLPLVLGRRADGGWHREPGSGGLVTALEPVLRRRGGTWIGWPGVPEEDAEGLSAALRENPLGGAYEVEAVSITEQERSDFYHGFCNEALWPLFHGLPERCRFQPAYWDAYRNVNRKYAGTILRAAPAKRLVWVHDYQLMTVGEELRRAGCANRTAFFLHIPFPAPDLFERLPRGRELLQALLCYDYVGFQTERDRRNFLECVRQLLPFEAQAHDQLVVLRASPDRPCRVGVHPISIDYGVFGEGARSHGVAARTRELRAELGVEWVLLGVDRLDYSKGIPEKLIAFERLLEQRSELRGRTTLVQLVIPSRVSIPAYQRMKARIEELAGRVNGRFTSRGWVPIRYHFGSWPLPELLAHYRAADVAVVTSLRDGMNLVSKEYVAASVERGALVLSEFAGSAEELRAGALLVNPHDVVGLSEMLRRALTLTPEERVARLASMRAVVRRHDVHRWVTEFIDRAGERTLMPTADAGRARISVGQASAARGAARSARTSVRARTKRPPPKVIPTLDRPAVPPS